MRGGVFICCLVVAARMQFLAHLFPETIIIFFKLVNWLHVPHRPYPFPFPLKLLNLPLLHALI
jgi:hypothetical protein